jgi:type II secretory ATPase GspE/PulE/Tfp pilus assembly ATPase PilB-like protein
MQAPSKQILETPDIEAISPELPFLALVPRSMAEKTQTFAFGQEGDHLLVLTTNNFSNLYHQTIDKLQALWYTCSVFFTDTSGIQSALKRYDRLEKQEKEQVAQYQYAHHVTGEDAIDLIKQVYKKKDSLNEWTFIDEILRLGYQAGASDVHFQAEEMGVCMRLRKDGVLHTIIMFTHQEFQKYLMKLKYISGVKMNITEINQDGRFDFVGRERWTTKQNWRQSICHAMIERGKFGLEILGSQQRYHGTRVIGCTTTQRCNHQRTTQSYRVTYFGDRTYGFW